MPTLSPQAPTGAPIQPPSPRFPPQATRPLGIRPLSSRPKRETQLLYPVLPGCDDPGFWRTAFLCELAERQAGERLYNKCLNANEPRVVTVFLCGALLSTEGRLRVALEYWLGAIGGMAGAREVLQ